MSQTVPLPIGDVSIYNTVQPAEGPKAVPVLLDFTTSGTLLIDFTLAMNKRVITAIQSISVSNWVNQYPMTITIQGFPEPFHVPAYSDAVLQVPAQNLAKFLISTGGNLRINAIFYNIPLAPVIVTDPNAGSVIVSGTVDIGNTVTVAGTIDTIPNTATAAAASAFAIVTGGTPVVVFTAGSIINGGYIVNPNEATESLFVDMINSPGTVAPGTHGTTIELTAGASLPMPAKLTGAVEANAVTSGHSFTAIRY
jgi:hypothetical protein